MALVAAVAALSLAGAASSASAETADYGDAPDGRPTGYGALGEFPARLASDGARAVATDFAHLGKGVTREADSRQVDQDARDDGVFTRLKPCAQSEADVLVTLSTAGRAKGSAFLNLFFDWNRDGRWEGVDRRCGGSVGEWALKNLRINLAAQSSNEQLYRIRFRAGSFVGPMWYRAVLSVDEPLRDERGTGSFARGEVEDFLYARNADFECVLPALTHGTAKQAIVRPVVGADPGTRIVTAKLLGAAVTAERTISPNGVVTPNGKQATFTYRSRKQDRRQNPIVVEMFKVQVQALVGGRTVTRTVTCTAVVAHEKKQGPSGGIPPPPTVGAGAARLGWYSGPVAQVTGSGAIDFEVAKPGASRLVRKLQFTSRITCTEGVTSHHVHVSGTFAVALQGKRERFAASTPSFEIFGLGKFPGTFTIAGDFTDPGGSMSQGTLSLRYTHPQLGTCDTGQVSWQAPAAARPTHTH